MVYVSPDEPVGDGKVRHVDSGEITKNADP